MFIQIFSRLPQLSLDLNHIYKVEVGIWQTNELLIFTIVLGRRLLCSYSPSISTTVEVRKGQSNHQMVSMINLFQNNFS